MRWVLFIEPWRRLADVASFAAVQLGGLVGIFGRHFLQLGGNASVRRHVRVFDADMRKLDELVVLHGTIFEPMQLWPQPAAGVLRDVKTK